MRVTGVSGPDPDGPHLLLPEIGALLHEMVVWLPFTASAVIADERWLGAAVRKVQFGGAVCGDTLAQIGHPIAPIDAVYFGVPTVVGGKALFGAPGWDRMRARTAAAAVTQRAQAAGARLIVSGLGEGDISVEDRIADMGGGEVVAMKRFNDFTDWVIARWL